MKTKKKDKEKDKEIRSVYRTDLFKSNLTASKKAKILEVLARYRAVAPMLAREQYKLFLKTGEFDEFYNEDKVTFAAVTGSARRVMDCRRQVVAQLKGWVSNRQNDFRSIVQDSSLSAEIKHMLNTINKKQTWFLRKDIIMGKTGEPIPDDVRKLARSIMLRQVMSGHHRPDMSQISMRLSKSLYSNVPIEAKKTQGGKVAYWLQLATMEKGKTIKIPLLANTHHKDRDGRVVDGIQINYRDGELTFGVVKDMGEACERSRAEYDGDGKIGLDFGLSTMFATSEGQLLGQNWLERLKRYDSLLTMIAASQQRRGKKPRDSKRYRALTQRVRGFIRTEVGRVLNRLVKQNKPKELILESLDFRNPELSKRLNRIISNCGRGVIKTKFADLEERFGITSTEVNPAYTSQTCSKCGYVDKKNRSSQAFRCLWCGHTKHADLNAALNIKKRRALPIGSVYQGKAAVLAGVMSAFSERRVRSLRPGRTGSRVAPADPRHENPYFKSRGEDTRKRQKFSGNSGKITSITGAYDEAPVAGVGLPG